MNANWKGLVPLAAQIAAQKTEDMGGVPPTVRRLHYLLVSDPAAVELGYRNKKPHYKRLSTLTGKLRRNYQFPALADESRWIEEASGYGSAKSLVAGLAHLTIDRSQFMTQPVIVVSEKQGLVPLLRSRFGWMDVTSIGGYASVTHGQDIARRFQQVVYLGDHDKDGWLIEANLGSYGLDIHRVALTSEQMEQHGIPSLEGKPGSAEVDSLDDDLMLECVGSAVSELSGLELDDHYFPVLPDADQLEAANRSRFEEIANEWETTS